MDGGLYYDESEHPDAKRYTLKEYSKLGKYSLMTREFKRETLKLNSSNLDSGNQTVNRSSIELTQEQP